jgi:signal transduction histidine kinase
MQAQQSNALGPGRIWWITAVLIVLLSVGISAWLFDHQQHAEEVGFDAQADALSEGLQDGYLRILSVAGAARGLAAASEEVTEHEFITFFRSLDDATLGVTAGLGYHPPGSAPVTVRRGEYIRQPPPIVNPEAQRAASISGVMHTGGPGFLEHGWRGRAAAYSLHVPLLGSFQGEERGVVSALFFVQDLLDEAMAETSYSGLVSASLRDVTSDPPQPVAEVGEPTGHLLRVVPLQLGNHTWELTVSPGPAFPSSPPWHSLLVILAGTAIGALLVRAGTLHRSRTRLRLVEERLTLAEELNRAKDDFLAAVSHELRTPLASIQGFAALVIEGQMPPEEEREALGIVLDQAQELANLVEDLLVDARASAGILTVSPEVCSLHGEVEAVLRSLPFRVMIQMDERLEVVADPVRLRQILRNLLRNASLYGGSQTTVKAAVEGSLVEIRVEDNGRGVPEEEAAQLFSRYARGSNASRSGVGLGIGLHLSLNLAELMGGDLRYERRNGWTSFGVTLPLAERHDRTAVPA